MAHTVVILFLKVRAVQVTRNGFNGNPKSVAFDDYIYAVFKGVAEFLKIYILPRLPMHQANVGCTENA
jgi:hypothetical protein